VRLNEGLQHLGHLALVGEPAGGDDLSAEALQADVSEMEHFWVLFMEILQLFFSYCCESERFLFGFLFIHAQIKIQGFNDNAGIL
jgi:hypothetical protein